jgi:hypothetical protein
VTAAAPLTEDEVRALRMQGLLLAEADQLGADTPERSPLGIATWFGAMQAQDMGSGQWSFGVRMPGSTVADIEQSMNRGEIVRTWPMRGTVHFIPAVDARWMLELTGVRALAGAPRRREQLGLTAADADGAASVLGEALAGGKVLSRAACVELLVAAGVHRSPRHSYHLLWYTSQIGVTCPGPMVDGEQAIVLLDNWAPAPRRPSRDEGLAELARRYFRSHGPASVKDFAGWTGLPLGDARRGIAGAGDDLETAAGPTGELVLAAGRRDLLATRGKRVGASAEGLWLLPGFDEFVLGFKDRSLFLEQGGLKRIVPGGNGIFRPTVVVDGRVVATWSRKARRRASVVAVEPFDPAEAPAKGAVEVAARRVGDFWGMDEVVVEGE